MRARNSRWSTVGLGVLGFSLVLGSVAAGATTPAKDPAKGEYYTVAEQQHLSPADRDRYCTYMTTTLRDLKSENITLKSRLDSLAAVADTLRNQAVAVSAKTRDVNNATRDLRLKTKAMNTYVVKTGDNLRGIALSVYSDSNRWKQIYDANKAAIGGEDTPLKPGTRLNIPPKDAAKDAPKPGAAKETAKTPAPGAKKDVPPPH